MRACMSSLIRKLPPPLRQKSGVDAKGQSAVEDGEGAGYNFVGDITVNDNEVTATGDNTYGNVNAAVDNQTKSHIAYLARFLGGLYRSGSASRR